MVTSQHFSLQLFTQTDLCLEAVEGQLAKTISGGNSLFAVYHFNGVVQIIDLSDQTLDVIGGVSV